MNKTYLIKQYINNNNYRVVGVITKGHGLRSFKSKIKEHLKSKGFNVFNIYEAKHPIKEADCLVAKCNAMGESYTFVYFIQEVEPDTFIPKYEQ